MRKEEVKEKIKEKIYSVWQEGKFIDARVFVHILAGFTIGLALLILGVETLYAHIIIVIAIILWEVFEIYLKIKERKSNILIDLIIGYAGFILAFSIFPIFSDRILETFFLSIIVLFVLEVVGFIKYVKYQK